MWKEVKKDLENNLPESADKKIDAIEKKALSENNQPQLLKTILYRRNVLELKEDDDKNYSQTFLKYAESKLPTLDTVAAAILHAEIANEYATYLSSHRWTINGNKAIDEDISKTEMKYWDEQTFLNLIDSHYVKALEPVAALKKARTEDYLVLFDDGDSVSKYIDYEKSVFEFLFHRTANYYQDIASADDIQPEWNTELWWLPDEKFAKADLGDNNDPIIRCLKIFQQLIAYNISQSDEDVLIYNDVKRYQFVNDILDEDTRYHDVLGDIRTQHASNPSSALIATELAQNLVDTYSDSDSATYDNYRKALELCDEIIKNYPKKSKDCNPIAEYIKSVSISIEMQQNQLPDQRIAAILKYRNCQHLRYSIIKVSEDDIEKYNELGWENLLKALQKEKPLLENLIEPAAETDYRDHKTLVALPELASGQYYLLATTEDGKASQNNTLIVRFQVSGLSYVANYNKNSITMFALDRKTGNAIPNAKVELVRRSYNYEKRKYVNEKIKTYITDNSGSVTIDGAVSNDFHINIRTKDDVLLNDDYFSVPTPHEDTESINTSIFTDRAIYRPGQTVYYKGIVVRKKGNDKSLVEKYDEIVKMKDANGQEVASVNFVTDEYGSFSGSFVIPSDRLNGRYRLEARNGSVGFKVEEYKRPSFEVSFESPKEQYKLNETVTVKGSVDAYAGFGLDDVKYSYRVVRKTYFPWRWWWCYYPDIEDEQIDYGEARTDENGKFSVNFNLKPSLKTKPKQQPVFTYEITVTATNAQGETHDKTFSIRAGYNEVCLSTDLPQSVEKSCLKDYHLEVMNMSGQPAKSRVKRMFYSYNDSDKLDFFNSTDMNIMLDRQMLSDKELDEYFPVFDYYATSNRLKNKTLVFEDEVTVDEKTCVIPEKLDLKPGKYLVQFVSLDDTLAVNNQEFTLYETDSKKMPFNNMLWTHVDKESAQPGQNLKFSIGTSAKKANVWIQLMHGDEVRLDRHVTINNEVFQLNYEVTEADRGGLTLKLAFVKENIQNSTTIIVNVPYDNLKLNVDLASVRDVLSPGAEEKWEVTVRGNDKKPVAASLLAGMYDASLDVFAKNDWNFSMSPYSRWAGNFSIDECSQFTSSQASWPRHFYFILFDYNLPSNAFIFRISDFYEYRRSKILYENGIEQEYECAGAPMFDRAEKMVFDEVMVEDTPQARVTVADDNTKGKEEKKEATPTLRENFNETAFFFPNLRTNDDGSATFSFTMPDALTRWNLMMLAYTKDRKTGYKTYSFKSSKPVMIMADMPRYMYDSDTLYFVANIINTGDEAVTPKAQLEIFDPATMEPIDLILSDAVVQLPTIVAGRSQKVTWKVATRKGLEMLAFRFTAFAGAFSDAEQHLLPVLSSEVFMTQTLPITVKAETTKNFDFSSIVGADSHERNYGLTLNFSTNPVWYAVQSLPYLANAKTDHAETAFYVFYANTLSAYVANNIPNLLNYIKKWQIETPDALKSQLEKDQDLKAIMLQETPWVLEAKNESEQRSMLANLFDINTMRNKQTEALNLIATQQKPSGGWAWVEGMPESPFISTYILSGFGKLSKMNALSSLSGENLMKSDSIIRKAVRFLEYDVADSYREMLKDKNNLPINSLTLNELYALSFFKAQNSDKDFKKAKAYYLESLNKKWTDFGFNTKSKAAVLLFRSGYKDTAKLMIKSFKECAQKNDDIGMYWPKRLLWFESHIATHASIMAAFDEIDQDTAMADQMRVWLLTQKQTNQWENSASTAEAVYALLMRGSDWLDNSKQVTLKFGDQPVSTEGGVAGTGFIQRRWNANEITTGMQSLTVDNPTNHLVWGGLFRQYFVPIDEVKSDESAFKIDRALYVERVTDNGIQLVPIGKQPLKVGDKLTVKITFESKQDMTYVFLKDLRAAGCEPLEQVSEYKYDDRMWYYQSTTDTYMGFFIEFLPKGTHQLEYSMYVTKEGQLSNGYALIQCLYAPEFSAYSDGMRLDISKQ